MSKDQANEQLKCIELNASLGDRKGEEYNAIVLVVGFKCTKENGPYRVCT